MPYIRPEQKIELNDRLPADCGELNFALTYLINDYMVRKGLKYATINEVVGVLECAKLELYRRVAAGYEDIKIATNGDVYNEWLTGNA